METLTNAPLPWFDDLPNDLAFLKECIERQNVLLGCQLVEIDVLRNKNRHLKRKSYALQQLVYPSN